jgi:hypothetical protein
MGTPLERADSPVDPLELLKRQARNFASELTWEDKLHVCKACDKVFGGYEVDKETSLCKGCMIKRMFNIPHRIACTCEECLKPEKDL